MMKVVLLLLAASLLTGCSLTHTASGTLEVSGSAVSGSVASLSAVSAASEEGPEKEEVTEITRQAGSSIIIKWSCSAHQKII